MYAVWDPSNPVCKKIKNKIIIFKKGEEKKKRKKKENGCPWCLLGDVFVAECET